MVESPNQSETHAKRALRRLTIVSGAAIFLLFGVFGTWAAITEIAGAVIAEGRIVVESSPKTVQHREGGIVSEILVRDGDTVTAGQPLVRLEDTVPRTELAVIEQRLVRMLAKTARLTSEFADNEQVDPPSTWHGLEAHGDVSAAMAFEQELLDSLRATREVERNQLRRQHAQLLEEATGYQAEKAGALRRLELLSDELDGLLKLQAQRMVPKARVSEMQGTVADLEGRIGSISAQIASTRERVHESELSVVRLDETGRSKALAERLQIDSEILELLEKRHAARDALDRTQIASPRAGTVRALAVHTIGGVVGPGETILTIVPTEDNLVIEARVRPVDIDQLYSGQEAHITFPGLNQRTTPKVMGRVIHIDSDLTESRTDRSAWYIARISVDPAVLQSAGDIKLSPGMPAQVFIQTTLRTPISYFLKPLTDQINRAFRES
jgi:HlyD family secretion protein